jgi:putative ABC transport system permease protein
MFPDNEGYRMLLVDIDRADPAQIEGALQALEERLEPYGVDAQETTRRLEAYHRVENTYLSTFQALGGLGLLLGVIGLSAVIARNVLERRRELALLGAVGFTPRDLRALVAAEQLGLLAAGIVIGISAALLAIAPVVAQRGGRLPALSLIWIAAIGLAGIATTLWATRHVRRLPIVASLRAE